MGEAEVRGRVQPLVVTNDNARTAAPLVRAAAALVFGSGAVCILGPAWVWAHALFHTAGDVVNIAAGFAAGSALVFLASHLWDLSGPIAWKIDDEGVEYHGPLGTRKSLRWRDVERVRWDGGGVRLQGRGVRIGLKWHQLSPGPRREAAGAFDQALRPDFDLPEGPEGFRAAFSRALVYLAAMPASLALGATAAGWVLNWLIPRTDGLLRDRAVFNYVVATTFAACVAAVFSPVFLWNSRRRWYGRRPR